MSLQMLRICCHQDSADVALDEQEMFMLFTICHIDKGTKNLK
jgi:hypothetical protein